MSATLFRLKNKNEECDNLAPLALIQQTLCHCERSVAKCGNLGGAGLIL